MSYEQVKDLAPAEFKRYCRVQPETFQKMVEVVSHHLNRKRRVSGRPTKLSVEDQVLMTLAYRREYRTFFHLAKSWGLHESSVWRTIRRVEDILTKSRAFKLPGKKVSQPADHQIEFIVVDVAETPVERPKKATVLLQRQEEAAHAEKSGGHQRRDPASHLHSSCAWPCA